jgi:LPXTG-motif cell wall-anchored protein
MDLPETMQPSSDERIAGWIGAMIVLSAGALWINRRRRSRASNG